MYYYFFNEVENLCSLCIYCGSKIISLTPIFVNILGTQSDVVPEVTGNKIKEVKLGMTIEQVISILGRPYKIEASIGLHNLGCKIPRSRLDLDINNAIDIKSVIDNFYGETNYCCEGIKEDMQNK